MQMFFISIILGLALFVIGLALLLIKRTILYTILGIEIMLQSVIAHFLIIDQCLPNRFSGQGIAILCISINIAEVALLLSLLWCIYKPIHSSSK